MSQEKTDQLVGVALGSMIKDMSQEEELDNHELAESLRKAADGLDGTDDIDQVSEEMMRGEL